MESEYQREEREIASEEGYEDRGRDIVRGKESLVYTSYS